MGLGIFCHVSDSKYSTHACFHAMCCLRGRVSMTNDGSLFLLTKAQKHSHTQLLVCGLQNLNSRRFSNDQEITQVTKKVHMAYKREVQ